MSSLTEKILYLSIESAKEKLNQNHNFYAFAIASKQDNEFINIDSFRTTINKKTDDAYQLLKEGILENCQKAYYKAVCVISNIECLTKEKKESLALRFELEIKNESPLIYALPYHLTNGKFKFDEPIVQETKPFYFR